jgi:hypothetical protein
MPRTGRTDRYHPAIGSNSRTLVVDIPRNLFEEVNGARSRFVDTDNFHLCSLRFAITSLLRAEGEREI